MGLEDIVEGVWPILLIIVGVISSMICMCYYCPCCPGYKRRRQGTVYQNIVVPPGRVEVVTPQNPTGYTVTQVVHPTQPVAYPVQQMVYTTQVCQPVQQAFQPAVAAYPAPPQNFVPPQGPSYGQPPPYSAIADFPNAPVSHEAYGKQAPYNPNYHSDNH